MRRSALKKTLVFVLSLMLVFSSNSTTLTPIIAYAVEAAGQSADSSSSDATGGGASDSETTDKGANSGTGTGASDSSNSADGYSTDSDSQGTDSGSEDDESEEGINQSNNLEDDAAVSPLSEDDAVAIDDDTTNVDVSVTKYWIDNGDSARPDADKPANTPSASTGVMYLYYSFDGGTTWIKLDDASALGLEELPTIYVTNSGTYQSVYSASVPTSVIVNDEEKILAWKLDEDVDENNIASFNSGAISYQRTLNDDGTITNRQVKDTTFEVQDLDGGELTAHKNSTYKLYVQNGDSWDEVATIEPGGNDSGTSNGYDWSFTQGSSDNIVNLTVSNLLKYDDNNNSLVYSLVCTNDVPTDELGKQTKETWKNFNHDDWFAPTYDNTEVPNYGEFEDRTYEGGTVKLLRTNTYHMTVHKAWLDDDSSDRPQEDDQRTYQLYLWRYIDNGINTYADASQVVDAHGRAIGADLPSNSQGAGGIFANPDTFIDGDVVFSYTYNADDSTTYLPKYDAEGYEYVYLARETKPSGDGYEQVFGSVSEDGTVTDTLPDGVATREGADKSIYADGTISNRLAGTVSVEGSKSWIAAAHQNSLGNYTVTMQLQKRLKAADGQTPDEWQDVADKTEELSGFSAEQQSQEISASMPLYDELGRELEYRWVEKSLVDTSTEPATDCETKTDADGSFTLTKGKTYFTTSKNINDADGDEDNLNGDGIMMNDRENRDWYASETVEGEDGSLSVTNTLEGLIDYKVAKDWYGKTAEDGTSELQEPPAGMNLKLVLYQNGTPYKTVNTSDTDESGAYYMTAEKNGDATSAEASADATSTHWTHIFKDLPKYDADGKLYDYYVMEFLDKDDEDQKQYYPTYEYDERTRTLTISNHIGTEGQVVSVAKEWLDDSETSSRLPVTVKITGTYEKDTVVKNADGTQTTMHAGDPFEKSVTLSTGNNWWQIVGINGVDKNSVKVQETKVGTYDVDYSGDETGITGTVSTDAASGYNYIVVNPTTTTPVDGYDKYIITNRRIGTVNIDVTKNWVDGNRTDTDQRPDAVLTITSDEGHTIAKDSDGYYYVQLKDGELVASTESTGRFYIYADADQQIHVTDETLTIKKDTSSSYALYGLPKYDLDGKVIHYTVSEKWADSSAEKLAAQNDYVSSSSVTSYVAGADHHSPDRQSVEVSNARSGSTKVVINKSWNDVYQYELGNRPDIKLYLWQSYHTAAVDDSVVTEMYNGTGFKDYLWNPTDETGERVNYDLTADFGTLPKYDAFGYEIQYYFEEVVPGGAKTTYNYSDTTYKDAEGNAVTLEDQDNALIQSGSHTLLEANGTFVNTIKDSLTFEGTKIWQNVPDGFPSEQVPSVKIYIDQYVGSEKKQESIAYTGTLQKDDGSDRQKFWIKHTGDNSAADDAAADGSNALPKYSEKGELYSYKLREAYTEITPAEAGEWTNVFESNDTVGSYTLINIYKGYGKDSAGSITVTKDWTGRNTATDSEDSAYPVLTFQLYRQYQDKNGNWVNEGSKPVKTTTLNANSGATSVTFSDLAVYSPAGTAYRYYIKEVSVNGEAVTWVTTSPDTPSGQSDYINLSVAANHEASAAVTNNYTPEVFTLKASKVWSDGNNALGIRPTNTSDVKLKIVRRADKNGSAPAINTQVVYDDSGVTTTYVTDDKVDVSWTVSDPSANRWNFVVEGLERWAPNGSPWIYTITEVGNVEGYEAYSTIVVKGTDVKAAKETLDLTSSSTYNRYIENRFDTKAVFQKAWDDSNNTYKARPTALKLKLQVAEVDSTSADAVTANYKDMSELGSELKTYFASRKLDTTFWASSFPATLSNLPKLYKSDGVTKYLYYRIVEVTATDTDDATKQNPYASATYQGLNSTTAGDVYHNYTVGDPSTTKSESAGKETFTTSVTNTLKKTSLQVSKIWADNSDLFKLRAQSTKFSLQYSTDGTTWADYKGADGKASDIYVTLTNSDASGADADTWTSKITDLPLCDYADTLYKWRLHELSSGANYTLSYNDDASSEAEHQTTATNTLKTYAITFDKLGESTDGGDTTAIDASYDVYYKLNGAYTKLFSWTRADGNVTVNVETAFAAAITSDGAGKVSGLPAGDYQIRETSAPTAYCQSETLDFKIASDDTVSSTTAGAVSGDGESGYSVALTDPLAKATLSITKVLDSYGTAQPLANVTFDLYKQGADGNYTKVEDASQTSGSDGKLSFADLLVGKYFIVESQVPENVVYNYETGYFFEVTNANNGTVVADTTTTGVKYTANVTGEQKEVTLTNGNLEVTNNSATITNKPFGAKITFEKKDLEDKSLITGNSGTFELWCQGYGESDYSKVATITDTNKDGVYEASGLSRGYYQLVEVKAPKGYTVKPMSGAGLKDNCVLMFSIGVGQDGVTIPLGTVYNERVPGAFNLVKVGSDGKTLAGTKFELQKNTGTAAEPTWEDFAASAENVIAGSVDGATYTTSEAGKLSLINLEWGTYRYREIEPTDGYTTGEKNADWVTFNIAANSTTVNRTLTNNMIDISIAKVDDSAAALAGASFTLTDSAGNTVDSWVSDGNAHNLNLSGTNKTLTQDEVYTLHEDRRAGYFELSSDVQFKIGVDGKISLINNADGAASVDGDALTITVSNTLISANLDLTKVALVNETCADKTLDGALDPDETAPLAGAEFTLSATELADKDAAFDSQVATSGADGKLSFTNLLEGTYSLTETATPEGYTTADARTVTVTAEGKVLMGTGDGEQTEVAADGTTQIVDDIDGRQTLSFTKVSEDNKSQRIAGAVYQLYRLGAVDGASLFDALTDLLGLDGEGTLVAEATTDANGTISFKGVLPGYKYRLHEKTAPVGSLRSANDIVVSFVKGASGSYELKLDDNGASKDGKGVTAELTENGLTWYEPQTEIHFQKLDIDGNTLSGAKLEVQTESGAAVESWTSTDSPYTIEGKLEAGKTYYLVETEAPAGYAIAEKVAFTVNDEAVEPGNQHDQTIIMVDELEPVSPNNGSRAPQTGDTSVSTVVLGALGIAGAALIGIGTVLVRRKK